MSWDIYLKTDVCGHCGRATYIDNHDFNYTSNMWPMLQKAGFDWDDINGKTAAEALPLLRAVIGKMNDDPVGYRALNPANGWGDYDSFIRWLDKLADRFREYPQAVIDISR